MEGHWWKCQVVGKGGTSGFRKGEVVFARKRQRFILLFDGNRKEAHLPEGAISDLKILSRLDTSQSRVVETSYSLSRRLSPEQPESSGELWTKNRR